MRDVSRKWKEVKLADVVSILGDGLHGTPKYDENGDYYFINGNNLNGRIVIDEKTKKVGIIEYEKYKKDLNDRTILVSINGTLGRVATYNGENVVLGKSACYFNVKDDYSKNYIKYTILSDKFRNYLNTHSTGTTIKNMGLKQMREFTFQVPPLQEQKAIAHILSTLDEKIEVNNQINKKLEEMAQTIFKHWFVDFEFPNENGEPYKSSGGEMVESELGMIPKGWEVRELEDIAIITMGQSPKGSSYNEHGDGTVFYQGRTDFTNRFPVRRLYTTEPKRIAKTGDILMSVRAPVGDINIANEECCIGRGLCSFRSKNSMNSYLLYILLNLKEKFDVFNGEGTVFGSINQKDLKGIKIIMPNDSIVKYFNDIATSLDKKYLYLEMESRKLTNLRDTLLPKLMSGELRVPLEDDDIS
ncbi:restriction endonuclease subunit S [Tissierella carlieri]|uniref:Restriction endonuclease subunit S n=1 Tax=Tissierella carlieri TaxID=689904 RepID=A0ABT1S4T4_9FIRM|nr:restriction endonuclease subunit S [Tissierella carlieri]